MASGLVPITRSGRFDEITTSCNFHYGEEWARTGPVREERQVGLSQKSESHAIRKKGIRTDHSAAPCLQPHVPPCPTFRFQPSHVKTVWQSGACVPSDPASAGEMALRRPNCHRPQFISPLHFHDCHQPCVSRFLRSRSQSLSENIVSAAGNPEDVSMKINRLTHLIAGVIEPAISEELHHVQDFIGVRLNLDHEYRAVCLQNPSRSLENVVLEPLDVDLDEIN